MPSYMLLLYSREEDFQDTSPEEMQQLAVKHLSRWTEGVQGATRARLRPKVRVGEPRQEILAEIEKQNPELVITATHGHSGFDRFLLGSIAEAVARRSRANVLVVPVKDADAPDAVLAPPEEAEERSGASELSASARRRIALSEALGPDTTPPS